MLSAKIISCGGAGDIVENNLWLHFEHGRIGSITGFDPTKRFIGSVGLSANLLSCALSPDKHRMWGPKVAGDDIYIYEIGTATGNELGSFKAPASENYGVVFAPDTNRIWLAGDASEYLYEIGTTDGVIVGSFVAEFDGGRRTLAFATDKNNFWMYERNTPYIWNLSTVDASVLGSLAYPVSQNAVPGGLTYAADNHRLWFAERDTDYMYEMGTITGNLVGSLPTPASDTIGLALSEKNRLWNMDSTTNYLIEIGTAYERANPGTYVHFQTTFGQKPDVALGPIGALSQDVYFKEPTVGSFFIDAGTHPAKAMWIAWGSRA